MSPSASTTSASRIPKLPPRQRRRIGEGLIQEKTARLVHRDDAEGRAREEIIPLGQDRAAPEIRGVVEIVELVAREARRVAAVVRSLQTLVEARGDAAGEAVREQRVDIPERLLAQRIDGVADPADRFRHRVEVGRGRAGHVHDRVELRQCAVARGLDAVEQGLDIDLVQLEGLREAGQRRGQGRGARKVPFEVRVEQQARFERQDPLLGRRKDGARRRRGRTVHRMPRSAHDRIPSLQPPPRRISKSLAIL